MQKKFLQTMISCFFGFQTKDYLNFIDKHAPLSLKETDFFGFQSKGISTTPITCPPRITFSMMQALIQKHYKEAFVENDVHMLQDCESMRKVLVNVEEENDDLRSIMYFTVMANSFGIAYKVLPRLPITHVQIHSIIALPSLIKEHVYNITSAFEWIYKCHEPCEFDCSLLSSRWKNVLSLYHEYDFNE